MGVFVSEVLKEYQRMQERYKLPQLDRLQSVFQFELDECNNIDNIRDEISDRLFDFTERVIEPLIWSTHNCHMIERDMLNNEESSELFTIYRKIQSLRWKNNLLAIRPDAVGTAEWIRDMWDFWRGFEGRAVNLCTKFSDGWETLRFKETTTDYHS